MKPKFEHDCEDCAFLGHFYDHDVYRCGRSILARYGNEGGEYQSMPKSALIDSLGTQSWSEDAGFRAMVAALSCQVLGDTPRTFQRFSSIDDVKAAVYKLRWDALFGESSHDIVPDPSWGVEADTAFQHFYIARSLLEQAEHHLAIAARYDRECWKKYRQTQETAK